MPTLVHVHLATIPHRARTHGGHTAHRWVRDRHTHAASAEVRGVGAFAGGGGAPERYAV